MLLVVESGAPPRSARQYQLEPAHETPASMTDMPTVRTVTTAARNFKVVLLPEGPAGGFPA